MIPPMLKPFAWTTPAVIAGIAIAGTFWPPALWLFVPVVPVVLVGLYDIIQTKHTILRNFPVIGHFRYWLESLGPELNQYFVESSVEGRPINRDQRTYVYERAKRENQSHPFGTELDLTRDGNVWMTHSIYPAPELPEPPRVMIGGARCSEPYLASIFNVSAMSFGSLSGNAVEALNLGAREGDFYHVTGEGGISPHHLLGGDLVFQFGTGYFGCRTKDGQFSPEEFRRQAGRPEVKMIEVKLSQGAKPGHGGILPAKKNTPEIAGIRGIEPGTKVVSPPAHTAFSNAAGLLSFVEELRELSGGKPVGFKLCVGVKDEFIELCRTMVETGKKPDFITVDGAEGGTGAAPIDFSNWVGLPLEEGLTFVVDALNGFDLKKDIRVIASGKIFTAFDVFRVMCLGADLCNSARGMMLALGCIQALRCDTNDCPTGITTSRPDLTRGLVVAEKWRRVYNYHHETVHDFVALLAAAGLTSTGQLDRSRIHKRISPDTVRRMDEIYPPVEAGEWLGERRNVEC